MASDGFAALGTEYLKEVDRLLPRVLLFALLVLMAHVLELSPSTIDAGGVKLSVKDVTVFHGGIALIFYYYLWQWVSAQVAGGYLLPLAMHRKLMRSRLSKASLPYRPSGSKRHVIRSPQQKKRAARLTIAMLNAFMLPFVVVSLLLVIGALAVGWLDILAFIEFVAARLVELDRV